jgi:hypothetical protein
MISYHFSHTISLSFLLKNIERLSQFQKKSVLKLNIHISHHISVCLPTYYFVGYYIRSLLTQLSKVTGAGSHPASCWTLSTGIKWPDYEADHMHPFAAEFLESMELHLCTSYLMTWHHACDKSTRLIFWDMMPCSLVSTFQTKLLHLSSGFMKLFSEDWGSRFCWNVDTYIKLNKALYLIKSLRDSVSLQVLRNVYFTKFESILKYGIIFWGGGSNDTKTVFKVKKKL